MYDIINAMSDTTRTVVVELGVSIITLLLSFLNWALSVIIHECGHKIVTNKYCKPLGYKCYIKPSPKPHTECEYYIYLENHKYEIDIQSKIKEICIAGCKAEFVWLSFTYLLAGVLNIWFQCYALDLFCMGTLIGIFVNILLFIVSSDLNYYLQPWLFVYKYK